MTPRTAGTTLAPRTAAWAARAVGAAWVSLAAFTSPPRAAAQPAPPDLPAAPLAPPGQPADSGPPPIDADAVDIRAASVLLQEAAVVAPDGRHHRLLRALRFLEDPGLAPLFRRLRENEHAALRVHGLLGAAELANPRGVTTENLVDLERDDQRAEVVSAAMDGNLLSESTLDQLLAWPGLADGVKLLLATPRVAAGRVATGSTTHAAMVTALDPADPATGPREPGVRRAGVAPAARGLGRRGLAALLLHQMGDSRGTQGLIDLNNTAVPSRDPVRAALLETARRHGLHRVGTWAYSVAAEPDVAPRLGDRALEVAAGLGDPRAHRRWALQVLAVEDDLSARTRLALTGLRFARAAEPETFNLLAVDGDPFVAAVGRAARAVAGAALGSKPAAQPAAQPASVPHGAADDAPTLDPALANLHATDHPLAHAWLAEFAAHPATPQAAARATARRLITGFRPGLATGRTRRLQAVLDAVETLLQRDPDAAAAVLPGVLARADPAWAQAVLLGLIRSRTPAALAIARDLAVPTDPDAKALTLVLRLRGGGPVGPGLRPTLTRALRGQTALDDELRVQVAWAYLQRAAPAQALAALETPAPRDAVARTRAAP